MEFSGSFGKGNDAIIRAARMNTITNVNGDDDIENTINGTKRFYWKGQQKVHENALPDYRLSKSSLLLSIVSSGTFPPWWENLRFPSQNESARLSKRCLFQTDMLYFRSVEDEDWMIIEAQFEYWRSQSMRHSLRSNQHWSGRLRPSDHFPREQRSDEAVNWRIPFHEGWFSWRVSWLNMDMNVGDE
jgi:hypothetical protein